MGEHVSPVKPPHIFGFPHSPLVEMVTPSECASQPFEYVLPSQPQTGAQMSGQPSGRGRQLPTEPGAGQVPSPKSQNSEEAHFVPALPPQLREGGGPLHVPGYATLCPLECASHALP